MALDSVLPLLSGRLGHCELLVIRGTSRELRALASEDHAWADCYQLLFRNFPLGEDELKSPAYPERARGAMRDQNSFLPCLAERVDLAGLVLPAFWQGGPTIRLTSEGILEDKLHPASEEAFKEQTWLEAESLPDRTEVYKARPLPLRCRGRTKRCHVECDSYASFTEHCLLFSHKMKLDPSRQFDPRFEDPQFRDPRHAGDGFEALPMMAKFEAMHRYRAVLVAWFRKPMDAKVFLLNPQPSTLNPQPQI